MSPVIQPNGVKVALVNLVSKEYYFRRQPAYASAILAGYLRSSLTVPASIGIFDMQAKLDSCADGVSFHERYNRVTREITEELKHACPDIVGLSMKWGTLEAAANIIGTLNQLVPRPLIIAGNTIATFGGRQLLQHPGFERICVVECEGEAPLKGIIERASQNTIDINDLTIYQGIPNVRINPEENILREALDLSNYPIFDEHTAPELFYGPPHETNAYWLETSRGCPWSHCTFCSISQLYGGSKWRPFSVELILDRIERHIRNGRCNAFYPNDSEFFGSTSDEDFEKTMMRAEDIAMGIMSLNSRYHVEIEIVAFPARADTIFKEGEDEKNKTRIDIYKLLKRAGFRRAYLGIESGSDTQLKRYGKGVTASANKEAIRILRDEIRMPFEPGFIFIDPRCKAAELRQNLDFIRDTELTKCDSRLFGSLRVQAGSPIARNLIRGSLVSGDMDLDTVSYPVVGYENPEVNKINEIYAEWEKLSRDLVSYISKNSGLISCIGKKMEGADKTTKDLLDELRDLDRLFLEDCVSDIDADLRTTLLRHADDLLSILERIKNELGAGQILDGAGNLNNILTEAINRTLDLIGPK